MDLWSKLKMKVQGEPGGPPEPPQTPPPLRRGTGSHLPAVIEAEERNARTSRVLSEVDVAATGNELPPASEEKTVESMLIAGLDKGAMVFLKVLENDQRDGDGNYRIDAKTRMEAFKMVSDYLVKRQKAGANERQDGMPPYEKIRKWLDDQGFEIRPKPKRGRPSEAELRKRAEVLGEDAVVVEPEPPPVSDDAALKQRLEALAELRGAKNAQT